MLDNSAGESQEARNSQQNGKSPLLALCKTVPAPDCSFCRPRNEQNSTHRISKFTVFIVGASILPLLPFESLPVLVGVVVTAAIAFFWKGIAGVIAVRWCARAVGVGTALLIAIFIIGEGLGMSTIMEWVSAFMVVVVFVGIVITFFWEGIGGMLVALVALALDMMASSHQSLFWLPFVFFGLASIYCWWRTRRLSLTSQPAI